MADPSLDPEVIKFRQERAAALRQQFLKEINNPHRHATGEGGHVFDPALQRFMSKKATYWFNFKPSLKSGRAFMFYSLLPIGIFAYVLDQDRNKMEQKYRSGQVAYADRKFKYI